MSAEWRLFAGLLLAPLCGGASPRPVTLGLVAPPNEPDAASLRCGVQLAVDEANENGRSPVALEVRSESGQWGTVGNDAVFLVCNRHVDAIIAPSDGAASHLILQVAGRTRVPVATLCSDSSVTDAGVPWAVRVVPRTDQEAGALFAAASRPSPRPFHWQAVVPAGRPGRAIRRDLDTAAGRAGIALDGIVEDGDPKADLAALVRPLVGAVPDGVLVWLPPARAGTVAAALRAAGYRGRLAGPGSLDSTEFVAAAGSAANGVLVTEFRRDPALRAQAGRFESRYAKQHGTRPDFSAAAAYDAARVLIEILRRAGTNAGYRQFPVTGPAAGITGTCHFDQCGNRTDALQVLTCEQGRFVPLSPAGT